MRKFSLGIKLAKEGSTCIRTHWKSILQTSPKGKINFEGLKLAEPLSNDSVNISKAIQKISKNESIKFASITSHYDSGGTIVYGCLPDDYVIKKRYFVEGYTSTCKFGPKKGQQISYPDRWEEDKYILPHYHIDKLWSGGKGTGTNAVQTVLRESLENEKTIGRITLDASCIDGKSSPAGFYYKLGFRFNNPVSNQKMEEWIKEGGKRENAPFLTGLMHLPKENIEQCLNYGKR